MKFTEREKILIIAGYINGYEQGHHDTVETRYTDSKESALDWLKDALDDGGLTYTIQQLTNPSL